MTITSRTMLALLLATAVTGPPAAMAKKDPALKAALKCRTLLSKKGLAMTVSALKTLDACHKKRDKGKFNGDCNSLDAAALKAKLSAAGNACANAPAVLANYDGDPTTAISTAAEGVLETSGQTLQGSPTLAGDKAKIKCHGAIGKARSKVVAAIVKSATACQRGRDKSSQTFGGIAADCLGGGNAGQASGLISKACGGVSGADVGSCASLPGCVIDSSTETGKEIARAIYSGGTGGQVPECHNGVVDPGETCDTVQDSDGCVNCQAPACGDGFLSLTRGEECDDGNTTSGDLCSADCHLEGTVVTATVSTDFDPQVILDLAGVEIDLGYAPAKVVLPGSGNVNEIEGRIINEGAPDNIWNASDTDTNSDTQDDTLHLIYGGTNPDAIPRGPILSIRFSGLPGQSVTAGDFACVVTTATDSFGQEPPAAVTCSVTVEVSTATTTTTTTAPPTTSTTTTTTSTTTTTT